MHRTEDHTSAQVAPLRAAPACEIVLRAPFPAVKGFFDENFDNQGFTDETNEPWVPNTPDTIRRKGHSKILKGKTGKLRRDRKSAIGTQGGYQVGSVWYKALSKKGRDYAEPTNIGFINALTGNKVPARKFIGKSTKLNRKLKKVFLKLQRHKIKKHLVAR